MKRIIFFSSFGVIVLLLLIFINRNKKQITKDESSYSFFAENDFELIEKQKHTFEENILIIFFSTQCDICELEAEQMKNKKPNIVDVIFVSPEHQDSILSFANRFGLLKSGFYFAQIDTTLLRGKYKPRRIPSYILYQNDLLIESGKGMITADLLKQKFHLLEE